MKEKWSIALCVLALAGCVPSARLKQDSPTPTLVSDLGIKSASASARRDKLPAVEASSPSRGLDTGDPTGGRLTLVEMHRMAMRENEGLKSDLRARDQQMAETSSSREAYRARSVELESEIQKMKKSYDETMKENQGLKTQLLEAAIRVAELEKELLQVKIDALRTRKPSAKAEPVPEKKPEPTPAPAHGAEAEKKEPKGGH